MILIIYFICIKYIFSIQNGFRLYPVMVPFNPFRGLKSPWSALVRIWEINHRGTDTGYSPVFIYFIIYSVLVLLKLLCVSSSLQYIIFNFFHYISLCGLFTEINTTTCYCDWNLRMHCMRSVIKVTGRYCTQIMFSLHPIVKRFIQWIWWSLYCA